MIKTLFHWFVLLSGSNNAVEHIISMLHLHCPHKIGEKEEFLLRDASEKLVKRIKNESPQTIADYLNIAGEILLDVYPLISEINEKIGDWIGCIGKTSIDLAENLVSYHIVK